MRRIFPRRWIYQISRRPKKAAPDHRSSHFDATMSCRPQDQHCDGLTGWGARWMWERFHRCWQPLKHFPDKTVIYSAVRFGEDGRFVPPPDPNKTVISLAFELNPNGTLIGRPRANPVEPSTATRDAIEGAIAAVVQCQPYDSMPADRYEGWKQVFVRIAIDSKPGAEARARESDPLHRRH